MTDDRRGPRRRRHRNSRLGCATCKRRRVKCSEDLPACNNCVKHRVHCDYLNYSASQIEELIRARSTQQTDQDVVVESADLADATAAGDTVAEAALDRVSEASEDDLDASIAATNANMDGNMHLEIDLRTFSETIDHEAAVPSSYINIAGDLPTEDNELHPLQPPLENPPNLLHLQHMSPSQRQRHPLQFRPLHLQLQGVGLDSVNLHNVGDMIPGTTSRVTGGVLDVLNFQASSVTQNFDNLLAVGEIIYPIYSIQDTPDLEYRTRPSSTAAEASGPFGVVRDVFLNVRTSTSGASHQRLRALPHATRLVRKIVFRSRDPQSYDVLLYQKFAELGEKIAHGQATLPEIRLLFRIWLSYFIFRAFTLDVMFLCLINLTTNYMITNAYLVPNSVKFDTLVAATHLKNNLLVHLIKHYAVAIKKLLALLNENASPELTSSISYILSLMSIYDPEATAYSTRCFRDGMFSVLIHTLHQSQKSRVSAPSLIPIYLNLMTNIARTVYLPAYDWNFLGEYQGMLARFGHILNKFGAHHVVNGETWSFVQKEYGQLEIFCQKALTSYIPEVNGSLDNIQHQEELFFHIFHRWTCVQPSRLLMVNKKSDPLEKILNLFSRLFRRGLYAVMPQMRFFYLRDLDSPLLLDVFVAHEDNEVFGELDDPGQLCVDRDLYNMYKEELKTLAAYATRVLTFFKIRMAILYRNLVHNGKGRSLFPILNVIEWRNSITDIKYTRDEFNERVGVREYPIHSFNTTYILPQHYPQILDPEDPAMGFFAPQPVDGSLEVDLLSLKPHGLLGMDAAPGL